MRSRRRLMSNSRKHRLCSSFNETESLCANYWAENLQHTFRLFSTKTYTQTSTSDADANRFIGVGGWGGGRHSHPPPKPLGRACEILQRPLCPPPARRLVAHAFFDRTWLGCMVDSHTPVLNLQGTTKANPKRFVSFPRCDE